MNPKKGEMSINMIIMVVIAIIILVILVFLITKSSNGANQGTSCGLKGGICKVCSSGNQIIPSDGSTVTCSNAAETCCNPMG